MRENKFRVWDKKKKLMYYCGSQTESLILEKPDTHLIYCDMEGFAITMDGTLMLVDECGNSEYAERDRFIKQFYTGLKDKSGKEIYEGDIVKCNLSSTQRYKGIIQFQTGHFFIQAFWYSFKPIGRWDLEKRKLCGKSTTQLNIDCEMEIIGNIYENPELI